MEKFLTIFNTNFLRWSLFSTRPKIAVVAGTFDHLHIGHKLMISKAFEIADHVIIGIMRDDAISELHKICRRNVEPLEKRVSKLTVYVRKLLSKYGNKTYEIAKIQGPYDVVLERKDIDYIIVSDETLPRAVMINVLRRKKGLNMLKIIVIPIVRDSNGRPISAHRFRTGELPYNSNVGV
ncbi:MAG: phosphopantetheine adenylyltransferase [Thermoprotei archaeon]|nr:MAG: phosphopantetheine adenylyltransferase [Thermoprotei archaeon]